MSHKPKLRLIDFQPVTYQGQSMWLLQDPWNLSPQQLLVPPALAGLLPLCDGQHTVEEIQAAHAARSGAAVPLAVVEEMLAALDNALLLENEQAATATANHLAAYHAHPYRPPALADVVYPADPDALAAKLAAYGADDDIPADEGWSGRGVISPHIDYQRGGSVYAKVWRRAAAAVAAADLVILFGTDHKGSTGSLTLTRQPYATPFGVLPTDRGLIDQLAEAIGQQAAYAEELNHRTEHSIELSAVWLHHTYRQLGLHPRPMVPILIGSFAHHLENGSHPSQDERVRRFLTTLRQATDGRRVLAVGSVDLAHVGPAFGDSFGMDSERRARLQQEDTALMTTISRGDPAGFYDQIAAVGDRNRICGFSPLYYMLNYLGPTSGRRVAYAHCPADEDGRSLVSIGGLLLD